MLTYDPLPNLAQLDDEHLPELKLPALFVLTFKAHLPRRHPVVDDIEAMDVFKATK